MRCAFKFIVLEILESFFVIGTPLYLNIKIQYFLLCLYDKVKIINMSAYLVPLKSLEYSWGQCVYVVLIARLDNEEEGLSFLCCRTGDKDGPNLKPT